MGEIIFREEVLREQFVKIIKNNLKQDISKEEIDVSYFVSEYNEIMAVYSTKIKNVKYTITYISSEEKKKRENKYLSKRYEDVGIDKNINLEEVNIFRNFLLNSIKNIAPQDFVWLCIQMHNCTSTVDETVNNFRVAAIDERVSVADYIFKKNNGCCKKKDIILKSPHTGRTFFFGLNYDHAG